LANLGLWHGVGVRDEPKIGGRDMSNKKNIPLLVSAAGWIGSFVGELIAALQELGVPDEDIHAFVSSKGKVSVHKIADIFKESIQQSKGIFHLLDNGKRTTEDLIKAGKYDDIDDDINGKNFPIRSRKRTDIIIELIYTSPDSFVEANAEAEKRGLKHPRYEDALLFGEQFPNAYKWKEIIFQHKEWNGKVLKLSCDDNFRRLELYNFTKFFKGTTFLAFVR
jgi:hypothetical protein